MKNITKILASLLFIATSISSAKIIEITKEEDLDTLLQKAQKPVILNFSAKWCGPCKHLKPVLEKFDETTADKYLIATIDIDKCNDVAKKYTVFSVPTCVIINNKREFGKIIGDQELEEFKEKVDGILAGKNVDNITSGLKQPEPTRDQQLMNALANPHVTPTAIKELLEKGANPNFVFKIPNPINNETLELTPLMMAMNTENKEVITLLLDYGADLTLKIKTPLSSEPLTLIELGKQQLSHIENIKKLLESYKKPEKTTPQTQKPETAETQQLNQQLTIAIMTNNKAEIKALLEKGANPNYSFKIPLENKIIELTALDQAIVYSTNIDIVKLLLEAGAVPSKKIHTIRGEVTPIEFLNQRAQATQEQLDFLTAYKKPIQAKRKK